MLETGMPFTSTSPSSGLRTPDTIFISVDLPQPEGPTMAIESVVVSLKLMLRITSSSPGA